jgi:hypothetical protein
MEQPVESLSRLLVREVFAAIQGFLAKLNRFNEAGFFREIPADSLLRERIRVTASMGGKFRKLVLLFRREVYFHISQSRGVIPACQRLAPRRPRGAGACVPKPSCGLFSDRERAIFSLSRTIQETTMRGELAVEKGTGSDAVSTLSNYLTIRGCKTVIGRLKRSGMFWTVRGGNAIIALRCCQLSGKFEDYWEARRA